MKKLILATTSLHRKKIFDSLGLEYLCEGSDVDEYTKDRPSYPAELVKYLAKLKAESVSKNHSSGIIVGFDSVSYFDSEILEKPKTREENFQRLKRLSGNMHEFFTGIHMINLDNGKEMSDVVETKAWIREIRDEEIEKFLNQDFKYTTCALGYSPPEYYSATFVRRIEGSFHNLCFGMPVEKIIPMLFEIGYELK
ncbi:Septum formation protein Maf [uncultured archaeon]|nr:Septum formation protein Maf [uncultured archaeon]